MENEFCTYEQALALKELGFDEPCFYQYVRDFDNDGELIPIVSDSNYPILRNNTQVSNCSGGDCFAAPLYQQAFRWFREKYKLHSYIYSDYSWNISGGIWGLNGYKDLRYDWDSEPYATYEEAESACLDKLIEICKSKTNDR